jgi:tetratricopeptide (TPR) repeat protein
MLQKDGDIEGARRIYEEILTEAPDHERTLVNLGVIYVRQGVHTRALELWERALTVNPENPTAKRNIELLRKQTDG